MNRKCIRLTRGLLTACMVLTVAATSAAAGPDDTPTTGYHELGRQVRAAYDRADYKKALELSEKMHDMRPDDPDAIYNIACLHCLLGERDDAYEWLDRAIRAGYDDPDRISNDYDLRTIRGERRFRELLSRLRSRQLRQPADADAAHHAKPASPADKKPPTTPPAEPDEQTLAKVRELTQKVVAAADDKDYPKALKLAKDALHVADIGLTNYNVACMLALTGEKDDALTHLDRAVEQGMGETDIVKQIEGDDDLDSLRKESRFRKIMDKARTSQKRRTKTQAAIESKLVLKVTTPKNYDPLKPAPLVVALHPFGGNIDDTVARWKDAADAVGAILVVPQGSHDMGGDKFEWGNDEGRIENAVMDAIDAAMDEHKIDKEQIVVGGFSQGGAAAWSIAFNNPDKIRGAIPICGSVDPDSPLLKRNELSKVKFYILVGADDRKELVSANRTAARALRRLGADMVLRVEQGVGHDYPRNSAKELTKALKFALGK